MKLFATFPGRAVALSALCCVGMIRPTAAGLIYEELAAVSAANVDAMALNADASPGEAAPNESDGVPGLPGGSSTNHQMLIASGGVSGSTTASADAPHFKRPRSGLVRPGGGGNGSGSGNRPGSGTGSGSSGAGAASTNAGGGAGAGTLGSNTASSSGGSGAPAGGAPAGGGVPQNDGSTGGTPPAGTDVSNPILPSSTVGSTYNFNASVGAGNGGSSAPLFADPPLASGFIFTTNPGSPDFASVAVTTPLPNTSSLSISFGGQTDQFAPGSTFTFPTGGVSTFHIGGISPTDVANGGDFETKLTFTGPGNVSFTEIPNPEPGSLALLGIGACGLWGANRRKRKS